ncbi:hypothetical protein EJ06DRAFT_338162 [Trichodelitschia bisporula]|uniref:Developmental regulator protein n=1 Tax=Trichodelitschia bisporula TaxID=703511 RepID=A0A6G1I2Y2_9PEZI|nr:hypothetical protein EJ06DRAFT_338162 [Trichodelitschia bisporula]
MPTYLVHGFRWPRPLIRIHIILQNLDDAAAEWLMAPETRQVLLDNFSTLYPELMTALPNLRFVEQYDPTDETVESKSQPFAYVADVVHEVKLGCEVDEVRGKGVANDTWSALLELRDKLAPEEKVAWFVVVCGDTERWAPPLPLEATSFNELNISATKANKAKSIKNGIGLFSPKSTGSGGSNPRFSDERPTTSRPSTAKGIKNFFALRKTKSSKSLRSQAMYQDTDIPAMPLSQHPPLPNGPYTGRGHTNGIKGMNGIHGHHQHIGSAPGTAV